MAKRNKKVSINLTEEEYRILSWLASHTRRSISEIAALILVDNAQELFREMQPKGELSIPKFVPSKGTYTIGQEEHK